MPRKIEMLTLIVITSLFLSFSMGFLMILIHEEALGTHEENEPPFALHWVRDSLIGFATAIPVALLAFPLSQGILRRLKLNLVSRTAAFSMTLLMSIFLSAAMALALIIFHQFGLEVQETVPISIPLHWLRDFLLSLTVAIPVSAIAFPIGEPCYADKMLEHRR